MLLLFLVMGAPRALALEGPAYIVLNAKTGEVLAAKNENERLAMASTTKVMTAIVALENAPLDLVITAPRSAVGVEGSSIYLKEGESLTLNHLLYGLMLASGNDAAVAIAIGVAGSVPNFVALMNEKARELGAVNTQFQNPHGLHHKDHYTTAYDLAVICRYAMQNAQFREIVGTVRAKIPLEGQEDMRILNNKNKILSEFEGGTGIKIGYTRNAGRCLCASASRNGIDLICVVLNDGDWFNTAMRLMNVAFLKSTPPEDDGRLESTCLA